ncbi:hypothetical protein KC926_03345 [Candidatus Kaiserbacteria bacterium]|nr:hypothetical protein [Candidatus Kaiserbacteria bacterium]
MNKAESHNASVIVGDVPVSIQVKKMENGERRTILVFEKGLSVIITEAVSWGSAEDYPWQDGHVHHGLTESYTLISGWAIFLQVQEGGSLIKRTLDVPGETITFEPGVPHKVLLGPAAVISTHKFGQGVPNPDRKNNDWWPADDLFPQELLSLVPGSE